MPGIVTSILQALFHYSSHHHHSSHPTCRNVSFLFIVFMLPFLCSIRSQHSLPFSSCYSFSPSLPEFSEDCSSVDVCLSSLPIIVTDYHTVACAPTTHAQAPLHPLIQHDLVPSLIFVEFQDVYSSGHLPLPSFLPCSRLFSI